MKKRGSFVRLFMLLNPFWKQGKLYLVGRFIIALFIDPALAIVSVRLVQSVIDVITTGSGMMQTIGTAMIYTGATFLLTVMRWVFLLIYDRWKVVAMGLMIDRSVYEQAMKSDYKYFDDPTFYDNFTFATGELAAKSKLALETITDSLGTLSVIVAMTAYLSSLGLWVILISIAGQTICFFAQKRIQKLGIQRAADELPHGRRLNYVHRVAYQREYAADMKSTMLAQKIFDFFDRSTMLKVNVYKKYALRNTLANVIQFTAWFLCRFGQLAYIIVSVYLEQLSVGMLAGLFAAAEQLNNCLNRFVTLSAKVQEVSLYSAKIDEFYSAPSNIEPNEDGASVPDGPFELTLVNVAFSYPNSEFKLRNLNFTVKPGEKVAIVGENGAGKTTLSKLLLRLYDLDDGDICYNGVSIKDYNVHDMRHKIGVAFQQPQTYAITVRENLCLYNKADDSTLQANLHKVGLNLDLDAEVTREFDENGVILSGGQAQKLALARLLHGKFGLLLLDEPSSALDPIAEYEIAKLMFDSSDTTTIMVAHRLSAIRNADRIYLISNGTIAEQGTHDDLMALNGKYAEMFSKQAENYVK